MGTIAPADHTGAASRPAARLIALLVAAFVAVTLLAAPVAAHPVGPQGKVGTSDYTGCLASGVVGPTEVAPTTDKPATLHLHKLDGGDAGAPTPSATTITNPACVVTQGGFFNSNLWGFVLALCVAAAALLFVAAIGKGASAMMRGQGAGLGQAVKSVLPLILMAALFGAIATLPVLLIPLVSAILNLVLTGVGSLIPG